MGVTDIFKSLGAYHSETLSKYRGKPWDVAQLDYDDLPQFIPGHNGWYVRQGWSVSDKVTGRFIACVYQIDSKDDFDTQGAGYKLVVHPAYKPSEQEFANLADCADAVWKSDVYRADQGKWSVLSWCLRLADMASAIAKLGVKVGLAVLTLYIIGLALYVFIFGNGEPMLLRVFRSFFGNEN